MLTCFLHKKKNYLEWSMHVLLILGIKSNTIKTWLFSEDNISPLSSYLFIYFLSLLNFFFIILVLFNITFSPHSLGLWARKCTTSICRSSDQVFWGWTLLLCYRYYCSLQMDNQSATSNQATHKLRQYIQFFTSNLINMDATWIPHCIS